MGTERGFGQLSLGQVVELLNEFNPDFKAVIDGHSVIVETADETWTTCWFSDVSKEWVGSLHCSCCGRRLGQDAALQKAADWLEGPC